MVASPPIAIVPPSLLIARGAPKLPASVLGVTCWPLKSVPLEAASCCVWFIGLVAPAQPPAGSGKMYAAPGPSVQTALGGAPEHVTGSLDPPTTIKAALAEIAVATPKEPASMPVPEGTNSTACGMGLGALFHPPVPVGFRNTYAAPGPAHGVVLGLGQLVVERRWLDAPTTTVVPTPFAPSLLMLTEIPKKSPIAPSLAASVASGVLVVVQPVEGFT